MNKQLINIKDRIEERSKDLRSSYLEKIKFSSEQSKSARDNMGCSNIAHAFASCDKAQQDQGANGGTVIGLVSAYNDMLSAHAPLKDYPDVIKNSSEKRNAIARVAGGVPAMCDGITQGEPGMELSLFSRDVIALSTAVAFSHNVFDAGICLGVCDKIVPGLVIGALSFGHFPIAMLPAGPMPTGISNEEKSSNRKKYASGEIDRSALILSEQSAYHTSGTCTFYGTANTNQLIIFNQYHSSIKKLKKNDNTEEILREFEYLFLKEIGYQIDFENEYSSGDAIESNSFYEFAPQSGFKRAEKGFLGKDLQEIARKEYNPINLKTFKAINRKSFEYYFEELNIKSRGFFK